MFRRWNHKLLLIVGIGALLVLSGCNNNNNPTTTPSGNITLIWRGAFLDPKAIQPLLDAYHTLNPSVTVQYANLWPSQGSSLEAGRSYKDALDTIFKNGNTAEIPDLFMVENTWVGGYANNAAAAPSSVIDANTVKTNFYPAVATDFAHNSKVEGLPLWLDDLAIVYNKTILAAHAQSSPPTSTTDFKNKAVQFTTRSSSVITTAGFAGGLTSNVSFGPEYLNLLLLQNGVTMTDANGNPIFANSDATSSALSYYQQFTAAGNSWDSTQPYDAIAFLEGKLAMMVTTSWRLNQILQFNDLYSLNLNIGVSPMPQIPQQPVINWASYWGVMVANNRPNSTEAWKFLVWLTQPAQLRLLRQNALSVSKYSGFLYPRSDMQQDTAITSDANLQIFNSELPTAQSWYMVNGIDVRKAFADLISSAGTPAAISTAQTNISNIMKGQ